MKRINSFVIGLLLGAILFGGGAVYAASSVLAERSAHTVCVDGQKKEVEAYVINGENYFRLRDLGQMVGFEVYWDGAVQIVSDKPYTGEVPATVSPKSENSQAEPNPAIFSGPYTREAYDAIFEVLSALNAGNGAHRAAVHIDTPENRSMLENLLSYLSNGYTISLKALGQGNYEVYAREVYQNAANAMMGGKLRQWAALPTDGEKVAAANEFLCNRLTYHAGAIVTMVDILNAVAPVPANCVSYTNAMNYLCGQLGIPCITVPGDNHVWNMTYCDGSWKYTDASANGLTENHTWMLLTEQPPKEILDPEGVRFLQELLVPGSTEQ